MFLLSGVTFVEHSVSSHQIFELEGHYIVDLYFCVQWLLRSPLTPPYSGPYCVLSIINTIGINGWWETVLVNLSRHLQTLIHLSPIFPPSTMHNMKQIHHHTNHKRNHTHLLLHQYMSWQPTVVFMSIGPKDNAKLFTYELAIKACFCPAIFILF